VRIFWLLLLLLLLLALPCCADPRATILFLGPADSPLPALFQHLGYSCVRAQPEKPPRFVAGGDLPGATTIPPALLQDEAALQKDDDPAQKALRHFLMAQLALPPLGLPGARFVLSPNWDVRPLNGKIDTLVVHSTVIETLDKTVALFQSDTGRRVSAHYVVDRDGSVVQMVDERFAAWHAGVSELDGRTGVNAFSVGVELVNRNDGVDPYPDAQMATLARIITDLRQRWTIPDDHIVSHEAIARPVGRKSDPKGFDFAKLRALLAH